MKTIQGPFGGVDEQEMIEQFYDLHSRQVAEDLSRLRGRCHPHGCLGDCYYKTEHEVFYLSAMNNGFTQAQFDDFLQVS